MMGGIMAAVIGFANPIAGAAFAMGFAVISGILPGPKKDDPFDRLYKKIMAEVRELVTEKVNQAQFREFQTEAAMVLNELEFLGLLGSTQGIASNFEDHLNLMWLLMIQHDLRLIRYQLSGSSVCSEGRHFSPECRAWHRNCVFIVVNDVLSAERGVAVKLLELEREWGLKVDARIVQEVPELIDVLGDGYLQCMGEVQCGSYYADAAENASDVYRQTWERLPALMSLSDREEHKAYWEYTNAQNASKGYDIPVEIDTDFGCLDHWASENKWCGRRNGLLQAIYVPRMEMPMWDDDKVIPTRQIEHMAYHMFEPLEFVDQVDMYDHACPGRSFLTQLQFEGTFAPSNDLYVYTHIDAKCRKPADCAPQDTSLCFTKKSHGNPIWEIGGFVWPRTSEGPWMGCPAGWFAHRVELQFMSESKAGEDRKYEIPLEVHMTCCPVTWPNYVITTTTTTTTTTITTTTATCPPHIALDFDGPCYNVEIPDPGCSCPATCPPDAPPCLDSRLSRPRCTCPPIAVNPENPSR